MLQEKFRGEMVHTSKFKSAKENVGKRVLVVGAGTSGHDIAWEHVKHGAGEYLERLTSNPDGEDCLVTAEVVSGLNVLPSSELLQTKPIPERPYINEAPHTL